MATFDGVLRRTNGDNPFDGILQTYPTDGRDIWRIGVHALDGSARLAAADTFYPYSIAEGGMGIPTLSQPATTFTVDGVDYLLRDRFTSNQNPLTDGDASDGGGIGYRDVTGTSFYSLNGRLRGGDNSAEGKIVYGQSSGGAGWARVGGRTFTALITPDDAEGNMSLWLAETAGTLNGYGLRVTNKTFEIIEPDGNTVTALVVDDYPATAAQYLVGITLNDTQGAVYWVSSVDAAAPDGEWPLAAFPNARTLFISTLGTFATVYPTVRAASGYNYFDGPSFEDVRLLDITGWSGADGLALVSDRFDRADNASTLGGSWTAEASSTWGVSSNQAYNPVSAFNGRAYLDAGQADVWVVADITSGSSLGDWFGLLLRRSASGTWMRLYNNGSANVYLQKYLSGGYDDQVFATYAAFSTSQTKRWLVGCRGDEFRLFINGDETVISPTLDTDGNHTSGTGFGLFGDSDSGQRWDNFAVYPITFALPDEFVHGAHPNAFFTTTTVESDTFTDTNGTALTTHNTAWTVGAGTWTISSDKAVVSTVAGTNYAYITAPTANIEAEVKVSMLATLVSGPGAGLILRRADDDNYVYVRLLEQGASDEVEIWERVAGSNSLNRKKYLLNHYFSATTYTLTARAVGDVIQVYLDGSHVLTALLSSSALLTGRGVGLYEENGYDNTPFDDFTVKVAGDILPASIGPSEGFGNATVDAPVSDADVYPASIGPAETFGTPALAVGVTPASIPPAEAFGTATLGVGVAPASIGPSEAFGTAALAVGITPASVSPTEGFGTATLGVGVEPASIAPTEAFGVPTLAVVQAVNPVSIQPTEGFGTATLGVGVAPTSIPPAEAFGTPALAVGVEPASIAPTEAFGTATVGSAVAPASILPSEAFGVPAITAERNIAPQSILPSEAFGTAALAVGVAPTSIAPTEAFGTAALAVGVAPASILPSEAFGTATLGVGVEPASIPPAEAFGTATVTAERDIAPASIRPTERFGNTVVGGAVVPESIRPAEAFGTPTLSLGVDPASILPEGAFGIPVITDVGLSVLPASIAPTEAFGTATLGVVQSVDPISILPTEAFGNAALGVGVAPASIPPAEAFGTATLGVGVEPASIAPTEAFGVPAISDQGLVIAPTSILPEGAFGVPDISIGVVVASILPAEAFGTAAVGTAIQVASILPVETFGVPALAVGITPASILPAEAFGTVVVAAERTVAPESILPAEAFGVPELAGGIAPASIGPSEAFGVPEFAGGIAPASILPSETFGIPALVGGFESAAHEVVAFIGLVEVIGAQVGGGQGIVVRVEYEERIDAFVTLDDLVSVYSEI